MRKLKKTTAAVLAMLILALALPASTVFAADSGMRYGREKLGEMSNGANLQYVYDQLVAGCSDAKAEIKMNISGRSIDIDSDLDLIYDMFHSDYPEYFWVNGAWSASMEQLGSTVTLIIKPTYTMTGSALSAAKSAYDSKVNELTWGLSGSDYDKAKALHDRLIDTVTYISTSNDQNAYGALVEGKAVCSGYARAYQHLMMKAGIPAWYVSGTSINPSTNTPIGHAWNLVKLDGQWYYTDVTWDDQGTSTFYSYFNITTQQLLERHTIGAQYENLVPNATATSANYYAKEGRLFDYYDQARLVELLKKDNNKTQVYVKGDVSSFMNSMNSNLTSLAIELGATGNCQISYSISQLDRAIILDVVITQEGHSHMAQNVVAQEDASCLTNGKKAYYICDCGLKFLDQGCTQQITSDSQLEIKASEHTSSGWKNDAANHWQECIRCGSETANTRGSHSDGNKDNYCDTCSYALPVVDGGIPGGENTGSNDGKGTDGQTPNQDSDNQDDMQPNAGDTGNEDQSTEATDSTQSTATTGSTEPTDDTSSATDETTPSEEADPQNASKADNDTRIWVLTGGAAIVVAAGTVTAVVLTNKKKSK